MNVYHNGNGNSWETGSQENKLTPIPINKTFLWEEQEIFLPAVYVGKAGVVLDVCAKIPLEEMRLFLKKWDKKRRLSLKTPEEFEQMETDNPSCHEFFVDMCLNHIPLTSRMFSSLRWYPMHLAKDWKNDRNAEKVVEAYGCDRECCWYLSRLVYDWKREPIQTPHDISLLLHTRLHPVTTAHFTTDLSCGGEQIKTIHPVTGQEYTLTLHGCEQETVSFTGMRAPGMHYPEYGQALSYSVQPEISRELLDIRDCAEGDRPRAEDVPENTDRIGGHSSVVFMAGKETDPHRRTTFSSLHFEPVSEIRWRVVFQVKDRKDMEIEFSI